MKVVLLHAFPVDPRMWEPQRDIIRGFDVFAPTLYRRGSSIDEWATSVLDESGTGELVAVGASMGGYCALAMARHAPERVRGLLLAGSRAGPDSPERRAQRDGIARMLREEGVEAWLEQSGNPAPRQLVLDQSAEDLAVAMEVLRDRPDATDVIAAFEGPLLVVVGDRDELLSVDEAREIAESAPGGRLEVVEDSGHFVSIEQSERFNVVLGEFLGRWR